MDCKLLHIPVTLTLSFKYIILISFFCCFIKKPGAKVLYLGAASGTTVSHVSDIVGPVSFSSKLLNWLIFSTYVLLCMRLIRILCYVYVDRSCLCSRILPSKWA